MDIYLIRHAHVDYGEGKAITAYNPLTPLGHQMAARLAARCEEWQLQYLFVSTMLRAQQTADAITARLPQLPRLDMPAFEEASIKDLAGYPGEPPPEDLLKWDESHYVYANTRMAQRVAAGWQEVCRIMRERGLERAAIVAHGGPLNFLLRHFQGCDGAGLLQSVWFELDWTSTSCLRLAPGRNWIRWVNDARHIDDLRHLL